MKEEDTLLRKYAARNPFTVPEGYFESFSEELMKQLPERDVTYVKKISLWLRVGPWMYAAAMLCGVVFGAKVLMDTSEQGMPLFTTAETEQISDEHLETIISKTMMDDYTLYQYLTDADMDLYN